jgi:ABC-type Na+ efflux pump permease subunit
MSGTLTILRKEWRCFLGSDRGIFILYAVLIVSWSIMLAAPDINAIRAGPLWLVFFSVVISANFSNTVFIAERVNGVLEILLTSGLSRRHILYGKMVFVAGMSIAVGILCVAISPLWKLLLYPESNWNLSADALLLYVAAAFMNTASSACLSVRMGNPRMLHLANLLLLALLLALHTAASYFITVPPYALALVLLVIGATATAAAQRLYESEKILQPVVW